MNTNAAPVIAAAAMCLAACTNDTPKADPSAAGASAKPATSAASSAGAVANAAPAPSAAVIKPPEGPPACTVSAKKTWASGANKVTGLATTELPGGRVAVGLAVGDQPHVLVVGPGGEGKLHKVAVKGGTALSKPVKAEEGTRTVLRVTPVKVEESRAHAFVDYRDEYKDKRRRVACGPAEGDDAWINFNDVPYLDRDPKPTGKERADLFKKHEHEAGEEKHEEGDEGYHELRDCRSFADVKTGEAWIVGSVLRGVEKAEGAIEWSASLVVDTGPKKHEIHLHEVVLKGDPPPVKGFEVPISRALGDGYLLAARFGSSLRVGLLNRDRTLRGKLVTYSGFPTIPHAATDDKDTVLVTAISKEKGLFALRGLRVGSEKPSLPKALTVIDTHASDKGHDHAHGHDHEHDHVDHSETDPDFVRDSKGQRWLAYIEGERGKGQLQVVPVDEGLQAMGKPFLVSASADLASEARLLPLEGGALLVVSLREGEKGLDVVTEELRCEVMKE